MGNFKVIEVSGANKAEAFAKVSEYFNLREDGMLKGDATQKYKAFRKSNTITEATKKQFMNDYLADKKAIAGEAYFITVESASPDTRERPWTITDVKGEGARKTKRVINLIDEATGNVLHTVACKEGRVKKSTAKEAAKELILAGFHGKGKAVYAEEVIEGEPVAFEFQYTPSKSAKQGTWLIFGITKD